MIKYVLFKPECALGYLKIFQNYGLIINIIQAVEVYQLLQYLDMFKKNSTTAGTRIFYYHPTKCHIHFNINVFKTPL